MSLLKTRLEVLSANPLLKLRVSFISWALSITAAALCLSIGIQPSFTLGALLCALPMVFVVVLGYASSIPSRKFGTREEKELGFHFAEGAALAHYNVDEKRYRYWLSTKRRDNLLNTIPDLIFMLLHPVRGFGLLLERYMTTAILRRLSEIHRPEFRRESELRRYLEVLGDARLLRLLESETRDSRRLFLRREGEKIFLIIEVAGEESTKVIREIEGAPNPGSQTDGDR